MKHSHARDIRITPDSRPALLRSPFSLSLTLSAIGIAGAAIIGWHSLQHPESAGHKPAEIEANTATAEAATAKTSTPAEPPAIPEAREALVLHESEELHTPLHEPGIQYKKHTIQAGENLSVIFQKMSLSPQLLYRIDRHAGNAQLKKIMPGQILEFGFVDDKLSEIRYATDPLKTLVISVSDNNVSSEWEEKPLTVVQKSAFGIIHDSLFLDAAKAGLEDRIIMNMANLFAWDIDFAQQIRPGDSFSLIYEEHHLDDSRLRDGPILAAEFISQGRRYQAIRYTDSNGKAGYYTADGRNIQKAFLRNPVEIGRISSRFNLRRKHPILNKIRAHKGVDYAAPTGTPIQAVGAGKIAHAGRKGGYGKTVIIDHGGGRSTLYAHLSRYGKGIRKGVHVAQGQKIGHIGSTGLATGPHLHYEFRLNGVHRNPLTVELPPAKPVPDSEHGHFMKVAGRMTEELGLLRKTLLASAD